jgi:hypothetical protein
MYLDRKMVRACSRQRRNFCSTRLPCWPIPIGPLATRGFVRSSFHGAFGRRSHVLWLVNGAAETS